MHEFILVPQRTEVCLTGFNKYKKRNISTPFSGIGTDVHFDSVSSHLCFPWKRKLWANPRQLRTSHHLICLKRFSGTTGIHEDGSIHPQLLESQTRDLSERQFTVICRRVLAWCINIVPNMPIHHQAARGFWVCSDQICTQRWWGACWFCCRKVQIKLFVTSSFHRGGKTLSIEIQGIDKRASTHLWPPHQRLGSEDNDVSQFSALVQTKTSHLSDLELTKLTY